MIRLGDSVFIHTFELLREKVEEAGGNPNDMYMALVVGVVDNKTLNLLVIPDGPGDTFYLSNKQRGTNEGEWIEREAYKGSRAQGSIDPGFWANNKDLQNSSMGNGIDSSFNISDYMPPPSPQKGISNGPREFSEQDMVSFANYAKSYKSSPNVGNALKSWLGGARAGANKEEL